jgi:outer membrane protein assembly factor BamB
MGNCKWCTVQNYEMINTYPGQWKNSWGGYAVALDLNGTILWETANPFPVLLSPLRLLDQEGGLIPTWALNIGPMSVANGVVYWPSMDFQGHLIFLEAKNGRILGSFATGQPVGSLAGGASIVDGTIYVGSGYAQQIAPSLLWQTWALTLPEPIWG